MSTSRAMLTEILVATADPEGSGTVFRDSIRLLGARNTTNISPQTGTKAQDCGGHSDRSKPKNLLKSQQQQGKTNEMSDKSWGPAFPPLFPKAFPGQTSLTAPEQGDPHSLSEEEKSPALLEEESRHLLIMVVPPAKAALVPWKKSSADVIPCSGIWKRVWTSIPPGITILPWASMVFTPPGTIRFSPICLGKEVWRSRSGTAR